MTVAPDIEWDTLGGSALRLNGDGTTELTGTNLPSWLSSGSYLRGSFVLTSGSQSLADDAATPWAGMSVVSDPEGWVGSGSYVSAWYGATFPARSWVLLPPGLYIISTFAYSTTAGFVPATRTTAHKDPYVKALVIQDPSADPAMNVIDASQSSCYLDTHGNVTGSALIRVPQTVTSWHVGLVQYQNLGGAATMGFGAAWGQKIA